MFDTHKLNENGFASVKSFKTTMADAVLTVLPLMPDGREKSIFLTKLEEAVFFGTKAIAAETVSHDSVISYPSGMEVGVK